MQTRLLSKATAVPAAAHICCITKHRPAVPRSRRHHHQLSHIVQFSKTPFHKLVGAVAASSSSAATSQSLPWWERESQPNMQSINSIQQLVDTLAEAGDRLVVVEFYARWCASCRALYPKLCKLMAENPDTLLLKVEYDDNKQMCKTLGVKSIPLFHFYKGAQGRVDAFSCSLAKIQKLKDAIEIYSAPFCSIGAIHGVEEFPDVVPQSSSAAAAAASSMPSYAMTASLEPMVLVHAQPLAFAAEPAPCVAV